MSKVSNIIYADDTTLSSILRAFKPNTPSENIEDNIYTELYKISEWLVVNKLSLNITKTKNTIFQTKQRKIILPIIKI